MSADVVLFQCPSPRLFDRVAKSLGIEQLSTSQVSETAASVDEGVDAFRQRPLDSTSYPFLLLDAVQIKWREVGRVVNVTLVQAIAVNAGGHREILGLDVVTSEDGAAGLAFLRGLVSRGPGGVQLVVSYAHPGLVDAIASLFPGAA